MNTRETCNNKLQDDIISVKFYTIVETIKKFFSIFREKRLKAYLKSTDPNKVIL